MKTEQIEDATIAAALSILRDRTVSGTTIEPGCAALDAVLSGLALEHAAKRNETFGAIWLDTQGALLAVESLAEGTVGAVPIPYRNILASGLGCNASGVILWHTHPSGNPFPSDADIQATVQLAKLLERVEIALLDHVVVSTKGTASIAVHAMHQAGQPRPRAHFAGSAAVAPVGPRGGKP
jgi:DNA repair protein RadC